MNIDVSKIKEIYGSEIINILSNKEVYSDFICNIKYLIDKNINDVNQIVESHFPIFLTDKANFKNKVDKLINKLGKNYITFLDENSNIWEELL